MSIRLSEVRNHKDSQSCWLVLYGKVYDVTSFLDRHPGGDAIILKYAGKDATKAFDELHAVGTLERSLDSEAFVGDLDHNDRSQTVAAPSKEEIRLKMERRVMPPLSRILSLDDLEGVARKVMPRKTIAFWSSGADDERTLVANRVALTHYFFSPRVLRAVQQCDPSTTLLGVKCALPLFTAPTSLGKLAHPNGTVTDIYPHYSGLKFYIAETNTTRAAGRVGVIQITSTHTTSTPEEMISTRVNLDQALWFQLYKKADDTIAESAVRRAEALGFRAICLTVDAVAHGNRETDLREQAAGDDDDESDQELHKGAQDETDDLIDDPAAHDGTSGALLRGDDSDMTWAKTIPWLRKVTKLPIIIKGIQCVEDAVEAANAGVNGIIISNHGGRQLEYSLPSIDVLFQLRRRQPAVFHNTEVYVDGGFRRGTDILKALCMGAKAVGIGRPILYANGAYGEAGILKALRIMEREIITGMRLLGVNRVDQLDMSFIERIDFGGRL